MEHAERLAMAAVHNNKVLVVGIAGGSGSGKTTITDAIMAKVGKEKLTYIEHDSYYRDQSHLSEKDRAKTNFDHPNSLETELLVRHLRMLKRGEAVRIPVYNFALHTRDKERTVLKEPRPVIVIEGILVLAEKELRGELDLMIYVDTDSDLRFIRRLTRDIRERGRSMENVIDQYITTVRPMHIEFVESSKKFAHVIIPEGINKPVVDMIASHVDNLLRNND